MTKYQSEKEKIRQQVIEWQNNFYNNNWTYQNICYYTKHFIKLAKRYGLVKEFRENGII